MRKFLLMSLSACAAAALAMPTKEELKKAQPLVAELTRLSTFALTANFFRGVTPRDAALRRESPQIASAKAV